MKTKLNTSEYSRIESIVINGVRFTSSYNHNYYYNKLNEDLILEEANDCQTCYYYRVENNGYSYQTMYLGLTDDEFGEGIFDKDYSGYPYRNENGEIELDNTLS